METTGWDHGDATQRGVPPEKRGFLDLRVYYPLVIEHSHGKWPIYI